MLTRKPLRARKPLAKHAPPKSASVLHPNKRIPLLGNEYMNLRSQAYERARDDWGIHRCECGCGRRVAWQGDDLHHVISRRRGGPDTLDNVQFLHRDCHDRIHGKPQWKKVLP